MAIAVEAVYENGVLKLDHPLDLAEKTRVHVVIENGVPAPRTPLGSELNALRDEILASGTPTLGWDEISDEVAAGRGGYKAAR